MDALVWYFFSVKGRISRQEFWWGYGAVLVVLFLVRWKLEDLLVFMRQPASGPWYRDELELAIALPKILAALILIWPMTTIYVKRLHDMNLSGWWLPAFIAICYAGANMHAHTWSFGISFALAVIGFMPGSRGGNRFGADPLAHSRA